MAASHKLQAHQTKAPIIDQDFVGMLQHKACGLSENSPPTHLDPDQYEEQRKCVEHKQTLMP
jgi:hypothetical protein